MPIILPKCPDTFELNKDKCRCSKIKTKKKAPKIKLTKKTHSTFPTLCFNKRFIDLILSILG